MRLSATVCLMAVALTGAACDGPLPQVHRERVFDDVALSSLLADPKKFDGVRVRLRGVCRIEFEGNALYANREAHDERRGSQAVWLSIGWPVATSLQQLDGQQVTVEGTFDAGSKGHFGMFAGTLRDVQNLAGVGAKAK